MAHFDSTNVEPGERDRIAAMLEESEKGSKRLRRDARGAPVLNDAGEPVFDVTPPAPKPAPSPRDTAELGARRQYVHGVLGNFAASSSLRTGEALDAYDREAFVTAALEDAGKVPASVKKSLADDLNKIIRLVESGERGQAVELARTRSVELAGSLPRSFVVPTDDDFDAADVVARIPR
jgi:hypothetical protein